MNAELSALQKKLIFRSWHRGTREMDLLLGSFADQHVPLMSESELEVFQTFLEISDPELYSWYTGAQSIPENEANPFIEKFLQHKFK